MQLQPNVKPVEAKAKELSPAELEMKRKEELLSKVRTIRERLAQNRGWVNNMKPNKVYVWVNKDENRQVHYQSIGYVVCTDPDIKSSWKKQDNTHQRGDLILYEVDKDLAEALALDSELRAVEAIDGAVEGFKSVAARDGVPTYVPR